MKALGYNTLPKKMMITHTTNILMKIITSDTHITENHLNETGKSNREDTTILEVPNIEDETNHILGIDTTKQQEKELRGSN